MDASAYLTAAVSQWKLLVCIAVGIAALVLLIAVAQAVLNRRYLSRRVMVWLEITPPSSIAKTPEATEQLFSVIHGTRAARQLSERLLRRTPTMSFEIVSTRKAGIRYLVQVEKHRSSSLQKAINSYISDSKVKEVEREASSIDNVIEFKETNHYVLPITLTTAFAQHDPLAYVTGAMTKLSDGEEITLQLIVQPVNLREVSALSHKILSNENILADVSGGKLSKLSKATNLLGKAASGVTDLTSEVYMGTTHGYKEYQSSNQKRIQQQAPVTKHDRPSRTLSAFELELMETMHQKVTRPLFQVNLRILVKSDIAKEHLATIKSALDGFSVPPYQSLKAKPRLPVVDRMRIKAASKRLPSLTRKGGVILSATELAALYHFPSSQVSRTDNLITSLSRTLPAPVSLKQNKQLDVIIGENIHHGVTTPVGLTMAERDRHIYVLGGTGNGKTTLLQYAILQDMKNGKGVAVVDPHGDMAETILRHVPEERIQDVIYFNPDDLNHPFAMNLLELSPGLIGNELLREKDVITESVVSIFRKIFSEDDSGGHRIEYVLRNTIHTALTVEGATIFTVLKLLQNPTYRNKITSKLEDEDLKDFWKNELGKAGGMQKVKMSAGITAKIGRFNVNAAAKKILGAEKSSIDFQEVIDSGKILICNFSKGLLGEDVSELFGITILAKLQLASLRRARIKQSERRPYYLYVDEFQNFATPSFVQMLSESRKYRMFLTMAEQSTSQQKDQQMVSIILANVGTVVTFRTGNPHDEKLLLPLFSPYIEQGEIANLNAFNFFARLSSVIAQEPVSGQTLLIADKENEEIAQRVIESSRKQYAQKETNEPVEKKPKKNLPSRTKIKKELQPTTPESGVKLVGHYNKSSS